MYESNPKLEDYICRDCGYKRDGQLFGRWYSWNCPRCGGLPECQAGVKVKDED